MFKLGQSQAQSFPLVLVKFPGWGMCLGIPCMGEQTCYICKPICSYLLAKPVWFLPITINPLFSMSIIPSLSPHSQLVSKVCLRTSLDLTHWLFSDDHGSVFFWQELGFTTPDPKAVWRPMQSRYPNKCLSSERSRFSFFSAMSFWCMHPWTRTGKTFRCLETDWCSEVCRYVIPSCCKTAFKSFDNCFLAHHLQATQLSTVLGKERVNAPKSPKSIWGRVKL